MGKLTVVIWYLALTSTYLPTAAGGSQSSVVNYASKDSVPLDSTTSGENKSSLLSQNGDPTRSAEIGGSRLAATQKLRARRFSQVNEFGITSLSWDDNSEKTEEQLGESPALDSGYADGSSTRTSALSSVAGNPSRTPSLSLGNRAEAGSLSATQLQRREAAAFIAAVTPRSDAAGHKPPLSPSAEGLLQHTLVDRRTCQIVVSFAAAKAAHILGGVTTVHQVSVDHLHDKLYVIFEERANVRDLNFWKKTRVCIQKTLGITKNRQRTLELKLPPRCIADTDSVYHTFFRPSVEKQRVDTILISLNFKPLPYRVPRTVTPKQVAFKRRSLPNKWVKKECSWAMTFALYINTTPVIRIDPVKGVASFDNPELKDMDVTLLQDDMVDSKGKSSCDWSVPILSRYHVSAETDKEPPEYRVQVDLPLRTDPLNLRRDVRSGNSMSEGMPQNLVGRGVRLHKRSSRQAPLE